MTSEQTTFKPMALRTATAHGVLNERPGSDGVSSEPSCEWRPTVDVATFGTAEAARASRDMPVLGATGRDKLQLSDLRRSPQRGLKQASARLTGNRMWLTVSAQASDVEALGGRGQDVSSLWLAAAVATRERAIETGETKHLWLVGLDDTQLLEAKADGWITLEEVATGINRLVDLVQKEMVLHFRSSAFDLLFNEDFEWDQAPEEIIEHFVAPLKTVLRERSMGQELAVVGLGPRLSVLAEIVAKVAGMTPWQAPVEWGGPRAHGASFESWLLQRVAPRDGLPTNTTAVFGGAPLLLPRPISDSEMSAEEQPETTPAPADDAPASPPSPRKRRRWFRGGLLRHHGRRTRSERTSESSLRKILFVIGWVAAVALAGHLIVEQATEQARMQQ